MSEISEVRLGRIEKSLKDLETWRNKVSIELALHEERKRHMDEQFDDLKKEVRVGFQKVEGGLWKVVATFFLAIVAGAGAIAAERMFQ